MNFVFSSYLTRCLYQLQGNKVKGLSSLIFANTDIVSFQTAKSITEKCTKPGKVNIKCGFVEVIIMPNSNQPTLILSNFS